MASNKAKSTRGARREERRRRDRKRDQGEGLTFGEVVAAADLVAKTSSATRRIIARADAFIRDGARVTLSVVSCDTCAAPKSCCTLRTNAWLFEGVAIAARLRSEGRDTAALREALRTSAQLMDSRTADEYRRPCVFLSPDERCTVYEDRPTICGTTYVATDPMLCSTPGAAVRKHVHPFAEAVATAQTLFERELDLPPVPGTYLRSLPRVVLLCLEAWERRDFAAYFVERLTATTRAVAPAPR